MNFKRKSKYKHIQYLNELSEENRLTTIQVNYKRLGSSVFKIFADEAKKERNHAKTK